MIVKTPARIGGGRRVVDALRAVLPPMVDVRHQATRDGTTTLALGTKNVRAVWVGEGAAAAACRRAHRALDARSDGGGGGAAVRHRGDRGGRATRDGALDRQLHQRAPHADGAEAPPVGYGTWPRICSEGRGPR